MTTNLVTPPRIECGKASNYVTHVRLTDIGAIVRIDQGIEICETVMMPHTTTDMPIIKRRRRSKKIDFEVRKTSEDMAKKVGVTFDFLAGQR